MAPSARDEESVRILFPLPLSHSWRFKPQLVEVHKAVW